MLRKMLRTQLRNFNHVNYFNNPDNFAPFSELPVNIRDGHMALFEGLPTFAGGFNVKTDEDSLEVYQYHWSEDKWVHREDLRLKGPRSRGTMFEVPRDLFGIC